MRHKRQPGTILNAWWDDTTLVVVSPTPQGSREIRVPLDSLPVLWGLSKAEREAFEIDDDGLFVHWPSGDIHLGWEQFEYATTPRKESR